MSDRTAIEWTDSTWNPVTGCTKVSSGCDNCYAETLAERFRGTPGHYFEQGFDVQLRPDKLDQPLRWKKPRRVFVNSMSDLFHDDIPAEYIARVFAVMAQAPQHTFQVLTKRHGRMRSLLSSEAFHSLVDQALGGDGTMESIERDVVWPLPNVWLGVSVETQQWAGIRVPALIDTPAAVRFLSCEPLLGPVDIINALGDSWLTGIDWIIAGGESGRGARPMHPAWVRSLRDQADVAMVPFLFKQWGEWRPASPDALAGGNRDAWLSSDGAATFYSHRYDPDIAHLIRVGKKLAGRELDGRTWDEFPAEAVTR